MVAGRFLKGSARAAPTLRGRRARNGGNPAGIHRALCGTGSRPQASASDRLRAVSISMKVFQLASRSRQTGACGSEGLARREALFVRSTAMMGHQRKIPLGEMREMGV